MMKKAVSVCLLFALIACLPGFAGASDLDLRKRSSGITPCEQIMSLLFQMEGAEPVPAQGSALAVSTGAVDPDRPMIALTFDDGPGKATGDILDILLENGGRATFYVIGDLVEKKQDLVQRAVSQGCEIGNHTWAHTKLTDLTYEEIKEQIALANEVVESVTGKKVTTLRPPTGEYNDDVLAAARELEVAIAMWSVDTKDWKSRDAQTVYEMIMADVKDGCIIICHDLYPSTAEAIARAMPELVQQGYQFVTVSELLAHRRGGMVAGEVYKKR